MFRRLPVYFLTFLVLCTSLGAGLRLETALPVAGKSVEIFPLDQVRPGMQAVGYSVFHGTTVEPFPVEIVGVLKNVWGPRQDIILARLGGPVLKTGVAAGMSGSPVYLDGKWLGAVSLRFGMFTNEPIAGITPAELMAEINELDRIPAPGAKFQVSSSGLQVSDWNLEKTRNVPLADAIKDLLHLPSSAAAGDAYLTPIETPLAFTGFHEEVLRQFGDVFRQMGVVVVQGGAGNGITDLRTVTDPEKLKGVLAPGSAVSGVLLAGDFSIAGSGTVTYNDGHRVLAFGHPFFNSGKVDIPMATAEVVTTLGSGFLPFKLLNTEQMVGVLRQDRHSGIMGVLGGQPSLIPVEITVRSGGHTQTYHYQMFENPKFTPLVLLLTAFNNLFGVNQYGDETTYKMRGNIELEGHPETKLQTMYVPPENNPLPGPMGLCFWLTDRFARIYANPFETPKIKNLKLDFELIPERRTATIDHVWVDRNEVHPGEDLDLRVFLRPYRGEAVSKDLKVHIPATTPKGELHITFSDADFVNRFNTFMLLGNRAPGLNEIIALLNREQANGQLYVSLLQNSPTAFLEDKMLPSLPSSVANVFDSGRALNRLTIMGESAIQQQSIPVDYVISGSQAVSINVK